MKKILMSNWLTLILLLVISIFSLFTILSVAPDFFRSQLMYILVGFMIYILISRVNPSYFQAFAKEFYLLSVLLLVATFIAGEVVKGSVRWINIGFIQFQPSEIVKPFLIIYFADKFCEMRQTFKSFVTNVLFFLILAGLVFKQPDLGNTIVYAAIFFLMLVFSQARLPHLFIFIGIVLVCIPIVFSLLRPYQRSRLSSFMTPENDPQGTAYHQIQSVITVGSGGFFGRGLGRGTQTHLLFLPEKQTDFIFASFAEEFGFVGCFLLLAAYFLLFFKLLFLIRHATTDFGKYFLTGVFGYIFFQSLIHVGMNLGLLPVTGVTLPLFSAGGSSITSVLVTLGMVAFYEKNKV